MIGKVLRDFLPRADLLPYVESILQIYNRDGRRDNKYKSRIKILVHERGIDELRGLIEETVCDTTPLPLAVMTKTCLPRLKRRLLRPRIHHRVYRGA